jgi:hypothetical protein
MNTKRRIRRLNWKTGVWDLISMSELKKDDIFDLYEPDSKFIGCYTALNDPFTLENGEWVVESYPAGNDLITKTLSEIKK